MGQNEGYNNTGVEMGDNLECCATLGFGSCKSCENPLIGFEIKLKLLKVQSLHIFYLSNVAKPFNKSSRAILRIRIDTFQTTLKA